MEVEGARTLKTFGGFPGSFPSPGFGGVFPNPGFGGSFPSPIPGFGSPTFCPFPGLWCAPGQPNPPTEVANAAGGTNGSP
ncbi:hypothetical protein F511_09764 [Dorcoceras hygrometricum]|uniref:Uncharacterized protein n=1 Tax=Dorcoceras hygrometricum TaxID=472368 RepID=A0A2Z7D7B8_9LAMI|nr:hypothetical protein F511_09764 [Dorcoceras hygrometricum]